MESNVDPLINAGILLKRTASENVNVIFPSVNTDFLETLVICAQHSYEPRSGEVELSVSKYF